MSQLSTQPVFKCRVCGKPVVVIHLSTEFSDPDGEQVVEMAKNLGKVAICPDCNNRRTWYIEQGRYNEWRTIGQF